jgi:hypothetical protein
MNEPAFPYTYFDTQLRADRTMTGMTLRDYFAAKAMQGFLANSKTAYDVSYEQFAEIFYGMADAMLKARAE